MKKIKLFLAAIAAMVTMGVNAQTWTGNDVAAGNFYLYNIGTGKWLSSGNSWGTQASLVEAGGFYSTLELSDGKYAIKNTETRTNNKAAGPGYLGTGGFMDAEDAAYFTFTAATRSDGVKAYYIQDGSNNLSYSGTGTTVVFNTETGDNAQWVLVSKQDRLNAMAIADDSNPVDATFLLKNAEFGCYKLPAYDAAWTWTFPGETNKNNAGDNTNFCVESYHVAFDFAQVVADAPKGYYAVRGQAFYRQDGSDNTNLPYFYVGDKNVSFPAKTGNEGSMSDASTSFTAGSYMTNWSAKTTYAGGDLKVGAHLNNNTALWCIWDNIQIQYYGPIDLTEYVNALDAAVSAAQAYESQLPAAVYANISAAITANNKEYETSDEYSAAITAINNAVSDNANAAIIASYAYTLKAKALYDQTNYTEKVANAKADFKAVLDAVEEKTTVADVNTANAAIPAALATFMGKVEFENNGYFDITPFFLNNADFSAGNIDGWETNYVSGQQANNIGYQGANYTNGDVRISQFIEAWRPGATLGDGYLRQTVQGLPEGKFVLEADAIATWQNDPTRQITGAQLFITADGVTYKTDMSTGNGAPQHFSTEFLNTGEGDVQFGLRTVSANCNWLCADNFTVKFYGIDLSAYETQLAAEIETFNAIKNSVATELVSQVTALNQEYASSSAYADAISNMQTINAYAAAYVAATAARDDAANANVTGSELTALTSAISDAPTYTDYATYAAKTTALTTATAAFTAAAPAYDAYVAYKNETITLWGSDLNVAAPTTAAKAVTAVQNLKVAQYNKVANDYTFSLTSKIGDFSTWTGTAQVGTPRAAGTPNSLNWEHWSGVTHPYYEQDGNGYNNEGGWIIQYTKTTTLPAGSYVVKVAARSSAGVTSSVTCTALPGVEISLPCAGNRARGINTSGAASWSDSDTFVYGNGNDFAAAEGGVGSGWEWRFLPFTLDAETEVTMTFYAEASTKSQWMSIGDGELLCTENLATDVAYSEDVDNTIVDVDPANVTITRNVKVGYNTVVLPFDITIVQMEAAFGTGAEVYTFSENSASANSVELNFTKNNAGTISANVPVLVKATAASTEQTFNGVQVVAPTSAVQVEGKYVDYVGVYAPTTLAAGDFFIATKDNIQQVFQSQGNNDKVNGFRAYFKAKEADGGNVKAALFIDGVATSISEINGEAATVNGAIYNLAGQRVNKVQKGIFIVNGKKVILK